MSIFSPFRDDDYYEELFEDTKPILQKQQLAQHNDFLLASWKEVTYFDANTAPIFRAVHFTWQKIELFVVNVAKVCKALVNLLSLSFNWQKLLIFSPIW